jgi:glucosamine-6-phosphate deaminase
MFGIGGMEHLAFNNPPADFQTTEPTLVALDEACRRQQVGEGGSRESKCRRRLSRRRLADDEREMIVSFRMSGKRRRSRRRWKAVDAGAGVNPANPSNVTRTDEPAASC